MIGENRVWWPLSKKASFLREARAFCGYIEETRPSIQNRTQRQAEAALERICCILLERDDQATCSQAG
jgi:hypothetical protein